MAGDQEGEEMAPALRKLMVWYTPICKLPPNIHILMQ